MKTKELYLMRKLEVSKITCVLSNVPLKGHRVLATMDASHCSIQVDAPGGMKMAGGKIELGLFAKPKPKEKGKEDASGTKSDEVQDG